MEISLQAVAQTTMNNEILDLKIFNLCLHRRSTSCTKWCYSVKHNAFYTGSFVDTQYGNAYSTRYVIEDVTNK